MFEYLRHRLLLRLAVALACGIAAANWLPWPSVLAPTTLATLLLFAGRPNAALIVAMVSLGAARLLVADRSSLTDVARLPTSKPILIRCVVHSDPITRAVARPTIRFVGKVLSAEGSAASGFVMVRLLGTAAPPRFGGALQVNGILEVPQRATSPGGFDYRAYLRTQGIDRLLVARGPWAVRSLAPPRPSLLTFAHSLRRSFRSAMRRVLPAEQAGLVGGLILGLQEDIGDDVREDMQATGVYHLLSVSGFHVVVVWALLYALSRAIGLSRRAAILALVPSLAFYCVLTGGDPPVIRSSIMLAIIAAAFFVRREADALSALGAASALFLACQPRLLFNTSFQLSFLTTATLILYAPAFLRLLTRSASHANSVVWKWTSGVVATATSAQLGSAPLVAHYFGNFSFVAPLANIPFGALTLFAFVSAPLVWMLTTLSERLAAWAAYLLLRPVLWSFLAGIDWIGGLFVASASVPQPPVWLTTALCFAVFGLAQEPAEYAI